MYEDHYGLTGRPFALTPDPRFWVETATHRKAMAYLSYGLAQGEGFIVVTGDIGAGKTTLVGHLMETLDRSRLHVVQIVSTQVDPEDLLRTVAEGLGVAEPGVAKSALLKAIERQLHVVARGGKRTLLIVDEVQALPTASLEELRMLSNFQGAGHALLQIMLLGQPEFRDRLHDPRLEQLRQRVIALHHLDPMEPEEVEEYLAYRLSVVGWTGRPDFEEAAVRAMYHWSQGVPRRLNQLAGRVLLYGAMEGIEAFSAADVASVVADLDSDTPAKLDQPVTEFERPAIEWPLERASITDDEALIAEASPTNVLQAAENTPVDGVLAERLAMLEERLAEQDEALRRVLNLLVDWVEHDGRRAPAERRDAAA